MTNKDYPAFSVRPFPQSPERITRGIAAIRSLAQGSGLSRQQVEGVNGTHLRHFLPSDIAAVDAYDFTKAAILALPAPRDKFTMLLYLNMIAPAYADLAADARRSYSMRELNVSYSSVLRLEKAATRQLAILMAWLTDPAWLDNDSGKQEPWRARIRSAHTLIFEIRDDRVFQWPHLIPPAYHSGDAIAGGR